MKNKTKAFILALCLLLSFPSAAFAETSTDNTIIAGSSEIISVHGYLGPDTVAPPDPNERPPLEIYVEVPVKILFAAFESDNGEITSPVFTITNLSATSDIKLEIENFEQRYDPAADLDGKLSLSLQSTDNESLVSDLFPASYSSQKLLSANLSRLEEGQDSNRLDFTIGGNWSGPFDTELYPVFDMTIKISAVE